MKTISERLSVCSIIASGILWGIISLFIRPLYSLGLTLQQVVLLRCALSSLLLGACLAIFSPESLKIRLRDIWMFIGTGVISMFSFSNFYFYTVTRGYAAVGGVLMYTSPAFIMFFSALLFKERITPTKLSALLLMLAGCVLVSGIVGNGAALPPDILACGIASGFFYGLYSIFGKYAGRKYGALTITFYTFLFAASACICLGSLPSAAGKCLAVPRAIPYALCAALFCTVMPYFLYTLGLGHVAAGRAAILVAVEPMVCAILGMCVYGEEHGAMRLAGIAAILVAVVMLSLPSREKANTGPARTNR